MEDHQIEIRKVPTERQHVLYIEVTPDLDEKVWIAAKQAGMSKSQISRLCIEFALPTILDSLLKMKSGKLK